MVRTLAVASISAVGLLTGCTLLVPSGTQCASNEDCVALCSDTPACTEDYVCVQGFCEAEQPLGTTDPSSMTATDTTTSTTSVESTGSGEDSTSSGSSSTGDDVPATLAECDITLPFPTKDSEVSLRLRLAEGISNVSVPSEIRLCRYLDPDCTTPLTSPFVSATESPHTVELTWVMNRGMFLEMVPTDPANEDLMPVIVDFTYAAALSEALTEVQYNTLSESYVSTFAQAAGLEYDPTKGQIFGATDSCMIGQPAAGIRYEGVDGLADAPVWYFDEAPTYGLDQTTENGRWGIFNAEPGSWGIRISEQDESGMFTTLDTFVRIVRPGWRTEVLYLPYVER
ncbi:MAG: hypothetical protein AAGF11_15040 [Myxococcota bacterium]